jgi:hypothetical protein
MLPTKSSLACVVAAVVPVSPELLAPMLDAVLSTDDARRFEYSATLPPDIPPVAPERFTVIRVPAPETPDAIQISLRTCVPVIAITHVHDAPVWLMLLTDGTAPFK